MHDKDNAPRESALSRRLLLSAAGTLGIAAAAGAAGVAAGSALQAGPTTADAPAADSHGDDEPLVVHVRDIADGTLDVFQGLNRHQVRDPELAARLAGLTRS